MRPLGATIGIALGWMVLTWPQAAHLGSMVGGHVDALFSVWRIAWIGAALRDSGRDLWNAPIFFPATGTLAYSDSVLLPGTLGSLLGAAGAGPVLAYNLVLSLYIVGAGAAVAALVRVLTGRWLAGLVAGLVFAFNPHQAEHFERLEIQTGLWIPLLFLCWHLAVTRGSQAWAAGAMLCLAGQWLSGMYFGLFLFATLPCLAMTWTWLPEKEGRRRVLSGAVAGLAISVAVVAWTSTPYLEARVVVGERSAEETAHYSARPADFLSVPPRNVLYGAWLPHAASERALFPGALALLLGMAGVLTAPSRVRWLYGAVALVALDLTAGTNGVLFPWLREWLLPLRGIRAPARAATLLMVPVAVFAGCGASWIIARCPSLRVRTALAAALLLILLAEYRMSPNLWTIPAPDKTRAVDLTPASIVAEFPMPRPGHLDTSVDAHFMVERIGLWPRLVNGSSGSYPPRYLRLLLDVVDFPDGRAIRALRQLGVTHVTMHEQFYGERYASMLAAARGQPDLIRLSSYLRPGEEVTVFALADPRPDDGR
jgi:hypothetical protein